MHAIEKIIAKASNKKEVFPRDIVMVQPDVAFFHDGHAPFVLQFFQNIIDETGINGVWDSDKTVLVLDHNTPPSTESTALHQKEMREFAKKFGVKNIFDHEGIYTSVLPEKRLVWPGAFICGTDTHTPTLGAYGALGIVTNPTEMATILATGDFWLKVPKVIKVELDGKLQDMVMAKDITLDLIRKIGLEGAKDSVIEYCGETVSIMNMDERCTLCNMSWEMGADSGYVEADKKSIQLTKRRFKREFPLIKTDSDYDYSKILQERVSDLKPLVASPHSLKNVRPVEEVEGVEIHEAFIGSCTGGRIYDLRMAAKIMKGKRVNKNVKTLIFPSSNEIYLTALKEGLIEIFLKAGAVVCNPGCGPCSGGRHMGTLAPGEVCVSVGCRNTKGRMGSEKSEIYNASPATAAASAVEGKLTDPRKFLETFK